MEYTYIAYERLINYFKEKRYTFSDYLNYQLYDKVCILRHDIDSDVDKALELSNLEKKIGVTSIYMILLDTQLYNALDKHSIDCFHKIIENGSEIALHFDASTVKSFIELESQVAEYKHIIEELIIKNTKQEKCRFMSYHIPNPDLLNSDKKEIAGLINAYSKMFFTGFKYISDSGHRWKDDPYETINSNHYNKIQCLTHPSWYYDDVKDMDFYFDKIINVTEKRKQYVVSSFKCFKDMG